MLLPCAIACGLAFCAVSLARPHVAAVLCGDVLSGMGLAGLFAACFVTYVGIFARGQFATVFEFFAKRLRKEVPDAA